MEFEWVIASWYNKERLYFSCSPLQAITINWMRKNNRNIYVFEIVSCNKMCFVHCHFVVVLHDISRDYNCWTNYRGLFKIYFLLTDLLTFVVGVQFCYKLNYHIDLDLETKKRLLNKMDDTELTYKFWRIRKTVMQVILAVFFLLGAELNLPRAR